MDVDVFKHAESRRSNPCFTVCMSDSLDKHLKRAINDHRLRRAFAAQLDMTMKRAKLTSARLSRMLRVPERDIGRWRAGIMVPGSLYLEK